MLYNGPSVSGGKRLGGRRCRDGGEGVQTSWLSLRGASQHNRGVRNPRRGGEGRRRGQARLGASVERQPQQRLSHGDRGSSGREQEVDHTPRTLSGRGSSAQG